MSPAKSPSAADDTPLGGRFAAQKFPGTAVAVQQAWRSPSTPASHPAPAQPAAETPQRIGGDDDAGGNAGGPDNAEAAAAAPQLAQASVEAVCAAAAQPVAAGGVEPDAARVILHFDVDAMYAQVCG